MDDGKWDGSPLADAMFAAIYGAFLLDVQSFLVNSGHSCASICGAGDSSTPTWADDTAILFGVPTAKEVASALATIAAVAKAGMRRLGLFGPGMTEAVLLFHGAGSKAARRNVMCAEVPGVNFRDHDDLDCFVRVVNEYTHLGTLLRADGHEIPNIRHRAMLMRRTLAPVRSRIMANPYVHVDEKRIIFAQRVLTKYLHGAGLWHPATIHEEQAAAEPLRSAMRCIVRFVTGHGCKGLGAVDVSALLDLPLAEEMLAAERIRAFREVSRVDAAAAWDAYCRDGIWLAQVGVDLSVALRAIGSSFTLPLPAPPEAVLAFARAHRRHLSWVGRHYLRHCRSSRHSQAQQLLKRLALSCGVPEGVVVVSDSEDDAAGCRCHLCTRFCLMSAPWPCI